MVPSGSGHEAVLLCRLNGALVAHLSLFSPGTGRLGASSRLVGRQASPRAQDPRGCPGGTQDSLSGVSHLGTLALVPVRSVGGV